MFPDKISKQLSVLILITNLVFGSFYLQYRGYGLSTVLLLIIFLLIIRLSKYERNKGISLFFIITATTLCLYTITSNLYFLVVLGAFQACNSLLKKERYKTIYDLHHLALGFLSLPGF